MLPLQGKRQESEHLENGYCPTALAGSLCVQISPCPLSLQAVEQTARGVELAMLPSFKFPPVLALFVDGPSSSLLLSLLLLLQPTNHIIDQCAH